MRFRTEALPSAARAQLHAALPTARLAAAGLHLYVTEPGTVATLPEDAALVCCVYRRTAELSPGALRPNVLFIQYPFRAQTLARLATQLTHLIDRELAYRAALRAEEIEHVDFPRTNGTTLRLACPDILYLEAHNSVCRLHYLKEGEPAQQLLRLSVKEAVALVQSDCLYQLKRGYVVNPAHVVPPRFLRATEVELKVGGIRLPVARGRVRGLLGVLQ